MLFYWFLRSSNGTKYYLNNGTTSIGRNRYICQIHLPGKNIGRTHTSIIKQDDDLNLHICARHPVILNNRSITIHAVEALVIIPLAANDMITIANETFHLIKSEISHSDHEETDTD